MMREEKIVTSMTGLVTLARNCDLTNELILKVNDERIKSDLSTPLNELNIVDDTVIEVEIG